MKTDSKEYTIYNAVTPVAITSSTDATPIVVTATAHGFTTGTLVLIYGHTTNLAANGIFKVTRLTADTFSLQDRYSGLDVAGTGAGAGASGIVVVAPKILYVGEFRNVILQVGTTGTATATLKIAGSLGKTKESASLKDGDTPNFAATVSPSNPYTFLQAINLDTAVAVNGATGLVASGADINNSYEVNINAVKYLTVFPISWTQGAITVKALLTNSN